MQQLHLLYTISMFGGQEWIRTTEVERQRIYSPPHLAALEPVRPEILSQWRDSNPRPADYKSAALAN